MTIYFCQKCNRVTSETKDFYVSHNKPCRACSFITTPIPHEYDFSKIETKIRVKCSGDIWEFHKNDPDFLPSSPHGHNYAANEKLNVYTGNIEVNGKLVRKLGAKHLEMIRDELKKSGFNLSE